MTDHDLPTADSVLAVCAHPDDESFGLGALLSEFVDTGAQVTVLCFTRGEASTLHGTPGHLGDVRAAELAAAATVLGVTRTELLDYPDGHLSHQPLHELAAHVRRVADAMSADMLLVFDEGGITGHPDHRRATQAALAAAEGTTRAVLAWTVTEPVATALNDEFGTNFVDREHTDIDITTPIDRTRQRAAMTQHASQLLETRVPVRRLALTGDTEYLRYLHRSER